MSCIHHHRSFTTSALFLLLLLAVAGVTGATPRQGAAQVRGGQVGLAGAELSHGTGQAFQVTAAGLTTADAAGTATYLSPELDAPHPFNLYVPTWEETVPTGATLTLSVRSRAASGAWTEWLPVTAYADWTLPTDSDVVGQMVMVPVADGRHMALQFAVTLAQGQALDPPILHRFTLSVIDAQPDSEAVTATPGVTTAGVYPKPPVVSRQEWCTNPDCNYSNGLEYETVSHLLVHHTVTSNCTVNCNWPAVVRAIWYFHTYDRGWGDIGYNYLVDRDGVIYEGHLGGDDVVGTHAAGANAGSMGVALIGTFTEPDHPLPGIPPPPAMVDALVELFAWKADQRDIDVYDAGGLPDLAWGMNNVAGHRDVYGTTTCPGDQAHDMIPAIRDAVADRLNFTPSHLYYDEMTSVFSSSGNLNTSPSQCGFDIHAYYTNSTTGSSTHWGRWRPSMAASGRYEVSVFAPHCNTGYGDTFGARYEVHHANGVDTVEIDQGNNLGEWQVLGNFDFLVGNSGFIHLANQTTTDSGRGVWFDAIRFRLVDTTDVINQVPAPNVWLTNPQVGFSWSYSNPGVVMVATLAVATDPGFNNIVHNASLSGATMSHTHTFGQDYANLYWRVIATTYGQDTSSSLPTRFGLDTQPPTSAISAINQMPDGTYVVNWSGTDATSGIATFNIDMQVEGSSSWTRLRSNTTDVSLFFDAPDPDATYWFRSQATDLVGNVEALHPTGDLSTEGAPLLDHAIMFPVAFAAP